MPETRSLAITALDRRFAALLAELDPSAGPLLAAAARTLGAARREGHVCLPLAALAQALSAIDEPASADELRTTLQASSVCGGPGTLDRPLILDGDRLYLQRFWTLEAGLASGLKRRLADSRPVGDEASRRAALVDACPEDGVDPDQRQAVEAALLHAVSVITGGPGTGKTTTLARLLRALRELQPAARVALAAPTGRAAARMQEAFAAGDSSRPQAGPEPPRATTIHRLLGISPWAPAGRYGHGATLPVDWLIVDEASMVDLALMARLEAALPAEARLVLVGDRDQLSSVEAGSVLADLCDGLEGVATGGEPSPVVRLRRSRRFLADSALGRLAEALRAGDAEAAVAVLASPGDESVDWLPQPSPRDLANALGTGYRELREAADIGAALATLGGFRALAALRRGPRGVEGLNRLAGRPRTQGAAGLVHPLIVRANDPLQRLANGDGGLLWQTTDRGVEAWFALPDMRRLSPAALPPCDPAWALSVHQSQGSEYEDVLVVLPEQDSPLLCRELLYTAVTRARSRVTLVGGESLLRHAAARSLPRHSGLARRLGQ